MLIYAHKHHRYEDVASGTVYQFEAGAVRDVSDEIGRVVQEAHPTKLCDVSQESDPDNHSCSLSIEEEETQTYQNTALGTPPDNRVLTTTPMPARVHQQKVKNPAAYRAKARQDRLAGQSNNSGGGGG